MNYCAFNEKAIKDKFLIPVVEELLDKLKGVCFFTKIDLHSGYYQVQMHPNDVKRTVFRTHHGHCKFLVMPFDLTNASTTFQALMNDILGPILRRFVLIF